MMEIYYKNNSGQVLDLMRWPYKLRDSEILGYEWNYTGTEKTGTKSGGTISVIRKKIAKTTLTLAITSRGKGEYLQALDYFLSVTEADILNNTPGRLYVGDYYYLCYIYGSDKKEWGYMNSFLENKVKLVSPYPFWCRELTKSFLQGNPVSARETDTFLYYPFGYAYRYSFPRNTGFMSNDHYAPCDFQMVVYGPCEDPAVRINGHLYEVTAVLYTGDYLKIDSRDNTVVQYRADGRKVNLFNMRNKDSSLFEKIPAGRCSVTWSTEAFGFDLTLFQERSEPRWIL